MYNKKHVKAISIFYAVLIFMLFTLTGCSGNKQGDVSAPPVNTVENSTGNRQETDLYDIGKVKDKLAIWFFTLPGNDHTGESILVRTPEGKTILIDSGTSEAGRQVAAYLSKLNISKIDYAIATHMHVDHIGGFPIIMDSIKIGKIFTSTFTDYNTSYTNSLKAAVSQYNVPFETVTGGKYLEVDKETKIEFLHPDESYNISGESKKVIDSDFLNDSSVVFKLTYRDKTFLFTGDITSEVEKKLIEQYGEKLEADVIKVPHHGASTSSSTAFIKTVKPKYSVMCIYAFNDFAVYDRYNALGNRPYVTSLDGTILLTTDDKEIKIQVEKERKGMLK